MCYQLTLCVPWCVCVSLCVSVLTMNLLFGRLKITTIVTFFSSHNFILKLFLLILLNSSIILPKTFHFSFSSQNLHELNQSNHFNPLSLKTHQEKHHISPNIKKKKHHFKHDCFLSLLPSIPSFIKLWLISAQTPLTTWWLYYSLYHMQLPIQGKKDSHGKQSI